MKGFYLTKALASLRHLGLIGVIASLAVFFSTLSLFALTSLSDEFSAIVVSDARVQLGGDVKLSLDDNRLPEDLDTSSWDDFAIITSNYGNYLQHEEKLLNQPLMLTGVKPVDYPLVHNYSYSDNKSLAELLVGENDAVISRDVADSLNIQVGDEVSLLPADPIRISKLQITGIIDESKSRGGHLLITQLKTAEQFLGNNLTYFLLVTGNEESVVNSIENSSLDYSDYELVTASSQAKDNETTDKMMGFFFKGMGILGLFIGSLGIVSSMQVIISRRRSEIAILKTIGYTRTQITGMLLLELLFLAVGGSILGIIGGLLVSHFWIETFNSMDIGIMLQSDFNVRAALISGGVSILATLLFTSFVIIKETSIRPADLLRDWLAKGNRIKKGLFNLVLMLVIGAAFAGLSVFIVDSFTVGIGIVLGAMISVLIVSMVFRFLLWLILRLPVRTKNTLELAWIHLRSSYKGTVLAVVAILVGVVVIGFVLSVVKTSMSELDKQTLDIEIKNNIVAYTQSGASADNNRIAEYLKQSKHINEFNSKTRTPLTWPQYYNYLSLEMPEVLEGRDSNDYDWDIEVSKGHFPFAQQVILPENYQREIYIGEEVTFFINQKVFKAEVSGFYQVKHDELSLEADSIAAIVSADYFAGLTDDYQTVFQVSAQPNRVEKVVSELYDEGALLIIDIESMKQQAIQMFRNTITMIISIAALALLAGVILIINAAALEVVNRKRSFGIYKAIGFANSQVRNMLLGEYAIVLGIAGIMAIAGDYIVIQVINNLAVMKEAGVKLLFDGVMTGLLTLGTISIILLLIFIVSRRYLQIKPAEVLRDE